ncbi:MAG: hypothetical protein ACE5HS_13395 [bacterium]
MPVKFSSSRPIFNFNKFKGGSQPESLEILIDERDLQIQLFKHTAENRFLGIFDKQELFTLFQKYQVWQKLAGQGFHDIELQIDLTSPPRHQVRLLAREKAQVNLLVELVVYKSSLPSKYLQGSINKSPERKLLFIEWLLLQNPTKSFTVNEKRLPGQHFSGLGLARTMMQVLCYLCEKGHLDGLMAVPGHYHNAVIFSKAFQYLDPASQGRLAALQRDLHGYPLTMASWAVELNCIKDLRKKEYFNWFIDWQVLAIEESLKQYFEAPFYRRQFERAFAENRFQLDDLKFHSQKPRISELAEVII